MFKEASLEDDFKGLMSEIWQFSPIYEELDIYIYM